MINVLKIECKKCKIWEAKCQNHIEGRDKGKNGPIEGLGLAKESLTLLGPVNEEEESSVQHP